MLEKLNWFCWIDLITNICDIDVEKDGSVPEKKNHLYRCWSWLSCPNWIGVLTLYVFLKLTPRKLESWFVLSFFLLRLLYIFINLTYGLAWNTVVMSGLVLLVATGICWINYNWICSWINSWICRAVGPSLVVSLEWLAHCRNVASLSLFYRYIFLW